MRQGEQQYVTSVNRPIFSPLTNCESDGRFEMMTSPSTWERGSLCFETKSGSLQQERRKWDARDQTDFKYRNLMMGFCPKFRRKYFLTWISHPPINCCQIKVRKKKRWRPESRRRTSGLVLFTSMTIRIFISSAREAFAVNDIPVG